jgi:acyl-coenzyme A thioesterase PaaI-like protein
MTATLRPDFRERAKANDAPVAHLVGFEAKDICDGRARVILSAGPQHANRMGTLHGGILCDIADAAMGMAFASTLGSEESFTTVELKINFFRPSLGRCAPPHRKRAHGWALLGTRSGGGRPRRRVKS